MTSLTHPKASFSKPVSVVLMVAALLVVAEMIYYLVGLYGETPIVTGETQDTSIRRSIEQIKVFPLFGFSSKTPESVAAPYTKLHMVLMSVAQHENAKKSSALIKVQSNRPKVFHVQDRLGRGIRIKTIEQNRVLLEHQGTLETLAFSKPKKNLISSNRKRLVEQGAQATASSINGVGQTKAITSIPLNLTAITTETGLGDLTSLKPSQIAALADQAPLLMDRLNINASGLYQPKTSKHIGKLIGLQDGDRIMSVNGRPFSDLISNPVALAAAAATGKIKLSVRRGSEDIVITTSLP